MRGIGWIWVCALASCRQQTPNLNGLACAGTQCLAGYVCDPASTLCVEQPVVGCDKSTELCPTTLATGGACVLAGYQLPCTASALSCATGNCRTCQNDHTWSSCSAIGGTSAGAGSSAGSSAGSTGSIAPPGAIVVVTSGSRQAFGKGARAISIGQPLIGNSQNSGGQVTFGFAATVQP